MAEQSTEKGYELSVSGNITTLTISNLGDNPTLKVMLVEGEGKGEGKGEDIYKNIEKIEFTETVTTIPEGFCSGMETLTTLTLPKTLTEIGNESFMECGNLKTVNFKDCTGLTKIGDKAFYECNALENYTRAIEGDENRLEFDLPPNIEEIGKEAFYREKTWDEAALKDILGKTIVFPKSLKQIGDSFFSTFVMESKVVEKTIDREKITETETNPKGETWYGKNIKKITTTDSFTKKLISYHDESFDQSIFIEISSEQLSNFEKIGSYNFYNCKLKITDSTESTKTPESTESTESTKTPESTESTKTPESTESTKTPDPVEIDFKLITKIGSSAFCKSNITEIKSLGTLTEISNGAFKKCFSLKTVNFKECTGLTKIGDKAFYECNALENYTRDIGDNKLEFDLPPNIEEIGDEAFYRKKYWVYEEKEKLKNKTIVFHKSLKQIGDSFFSTFVDGENNNKKGETWYGNYNQFNIDSPEIEISSVQLRNFEKIGGYNFYNCKLKIDDSDEVKLILPNLNYLGVSSFSKSNIIEIKNLGKITTVPSSSFYACKRLVKVNLNKEKITGIGSYAFSSKCNNNGNNMFCRAPQFISINLEDLVKLEYFGSSSFAGFKRDGNLYLDLSKLTKLESIKESAFYGSNITGVIFPNSLNYIGSEAFKDCKSLKIINLENIDPNFKIESYPHHGNPKIFPIGQNAFKIDKKSLTLGKKIGKKFYKKLTIIFPTKRGNLCDTFFDNIQRIFNNNKDKKYFNIKENLPRTYFNIKNCSRGTTKAIGQAFSVLGKKTKKRLGKGVIGFISFFDSNARRGGNRSKKIHRNKQTLKRKKMLRSKCRSVKRNILPRNRTRTRKYRAKRYYKSRHL